MGNSNSLTVQKISELNSLCTSKRFFTLTGLRLNFVLLTPTPSTSILISKILDNPEPIVQISHLTSTHSLSTLIGCCSCASFNKIYNTVQHLMSLSYLPSEDTICSICLDLPADSLLPCGHQFCSKDIDSWSSKNSECPMCRSPFQCCDSFITVEEFSDDIKAEVKVCKDLIFSLIEY